MSDASWQELFERSDKVDENARGVRYRARSRKTGRLVMLEVLRAGTSEAFRREARASLRVPNSGLIRCLDSSLSYAHGENGTGGAAPWVATEWLEGTTLAVRQRSSAPLSLAQVERLFHALRSTLHALHRAHVIHGDHTPDRVFIETTAVGAQGVRVFDFAVVPIADRRVGVHGTRGAQHAAAWVYRAPELRQPGGHVDRRTDIFAFGAVLCFCIAPDQLAEAADGNPDRALHHLTTSNNRELRALARVAQKCLSPDPEQRPSTADLASLFAALQEASHTSPAEPGATPSWAAPLLVVGAVLLFVLLKDKDRAVGDGELLSTASQQVDGPVHPRVSGTIALYDAAEVSNRGSNAAIDRRVLALLREHETEFVECTLDGDGRETYRLVLRVIIRSSGSHTATLIGEPLPTEMQNCLLRTAARLDLPAQWGDQILRAPVLLTTRRH